MRHPVLPPGFRGGSWAVSPVIVSFLVYGLLLRLLSIHFGCSLAFPEGPRPTPFELVIASMARTMTVIHVCFALLIGFELFEALRAPGSRGRVIAAVLGLICLWMLQGLISDFPEMWSEVTGG